MSEVEEQSVAGKPSPSTNSNQSIEETPTSSSSGGQSVNPPKTHLCKAYKSLDDKLKEQCTRYLLFHRNKQFGAFPDMHVGHHIYEAEEIPEKVTAQYFRGGIINTMAVFEAFLAELLEEACTDNGQTNDKAKNLKEKYEKNFKTKDLESIVLFHTWNNLYEKYLLKNKDADRLKIQDVAGSDTLLYYLLQHQEIPPIKYSYVIQNDHENTESRNKPLISEIKIGIPPSQKSDDGISTRRQTRAARKHHIEGMEDKSIICALLKLFWGIRCVMAHGDVKKTLDYGALKDFPHCTSTCGSQSSMTQKALEDASDLEWYYQQILKNIDKESKKEVERKIGRIPRKDEFEKIQKDHELALGEDSKDLWVDVFHLLDEHFSKPDDNPLPAPYAFFHMCRVDQWLRDSKTDMYITYRMLVRVNQFIHILAFRLTIAVATILEKIHGLPSGSWGIQESGGERVTPITKENIPNMIKQFEERHEKIVNQTKEMNLVSKQKEKEEEIKKTCEKAQEKVIDELKANDYFKAETPDDVWRVFKKKKTIGEDYDIETYLSIVKNPSIRSTDSPKPPQETTVVEKSLNNEEIIV